MNELLEAIRTYEKKYWKYPEIRITRNFFEEHQRQLLRIMQVTKVVFDDSVDKWEIITDDRHTKQK
ncbi:hypothetical protein [Fodinibius sediminis]|uniref:Uncharacterized protein n=1 Tax=Fodinibius sediminis TaxID=1214077 RepID=A0A521F2P0_9BACT|nr:hypothetical protein [Fodinibius sediminis]SMO90468.1 hypothetical protein SAMN06265218_12227 [Fodinibius sediminis]